MPTFYGNSPSMDLLARMGEIDAKFTEKKIGRTPQDVESLAWGFLQQNFHPAVDELRVSPSPQHGSHATQIVSGHPGETVSGGQGAQGTIGITGPPGPPGLPGVTNCGQVCDCLENCDEEYGACCIPGESGWWCADGMTRGGCNQYGGEFHKDKQCTLTLCPEETEEPETAQSEDMSTGTQSEESGSCNSPDCETWTASSEPPSDESEATEEFSWSWAGGSEPEDSSETVGTPSTYDGPPSVPTIPSWVTPEYGGGYGSETTEPYPPGCCPPPAEDGIGGDEEDTGRCFIDMTPPDPSEFQDFCESLDPDNEDWIACCKHCLTHPECNNCTVTPGLTIVTCPDHCPNGGEHVIPPWAPTPEEDGPWFPPTGPNDPYWQLWTPLACCCGGEEDFVPGQGFPAGEFCVDVEWELTCEQYDSPPEDCDLWCTACNMIQGAIKRTIRCKLCCADMQVTDI